MTVRFGLDYLAPLSVAEVERLGASFVGRYTKNLTAQEAKGLSAAGIDLFLICESTGDAVAGGRVAGQLDAYEAVKASLEVGMIGARPIYFAPADFDTTRDPAVAYEYFLGVASVLPVSRIGGYGGIALIKYLLDHQLITWAFQTAAWSNNVWDSRAVIRQDGFVPSWDKDNAYAADFGQFRYGVKPPHPVPAVDLDYLLPKERVEAKLFEHLAATHPRWHPHQIAAARAELVKMRKGVWEAANATKPEDWVAVNRLARYHALSRLTDWPPKSNAKAIAAAGAQIDALLSHSGGMEA